MPLYFRNGSPNAVIIRVLTHLIIRRHKDHEGEESGEGGDGGPGPNRMSPLFDAPVFGRSSRVNRPAIRDNAESFCPTASYTTARIRANMQEPAKEAPEESNEHEKLPIPRRNDDERTRKNFRTFSHFHHKVILMTIASKIT